MEEVEEDSHQSLVPGESQSTLCRRCYLRYGDQKSPHCEHVFCANCFDKSVDVVTEEFVCFACKQSTQTETSEPGTTQVMPDQSRIVDQHEHLAREVKTILSFKCNRFKKPRRVGVTGTGDFVVVEIATNEVLVFNSDGELKKHFPYLVGYSFTGGLFVTPNDGILLSLRNDKYNSVSFYSADGTFAFSAFLGQCADVTGLVRKENTKEILALDNDKGEICVINTEKSIHQQKRLKESGQEDLSNMSSLSSIAVDTRGDIIIHDSRNHKVLVYDAKFNFRYEFDTTVIKTNVNTTSDNDAEQQTENNETFSPNKCAKIGVDRNNCIFCADDNEVNVFSLNGQFVHTAVTYDWSAESVQDFICFGEDKMAVLLTGGSARRGEIRVYSYSIPGRFRNRDDAQCCTIA